MWGIVVGRKPCGQIIDYFIGIVYAYIINQYFNNCFAFRIFFKISLIFLELH